MEIHSPMDAVELSRIRAIGEKVQQLQKEGRNIVRLQIGEPDFTTPGHIIAAAKAAMDRGQTHYAPNRGLLSLRDEISKKLLRDNGIAADPATEILVTSGCAEGLYLVFMGLVEPGDEVITKGDWMQAALFAISVAVGLTPEMLPMIVTTSLAKGAMAMSKQKVIIKNLNSIQNLGSIDILCTDKTGTLTQDRVVLEYHLNVDGEEDDRVLRHAFLNSYFQTGLKNLIDLAVISKQEELGAEVLTRRYTKVDEIPFDFERRRMSVVIRDTDGKTQLITKGAVEEMLKCCTFAECGGKVRPLTADVCRLVLEQSDQLNEKGMRVIAVAQKTNPAPVGQFSVADEADMVLIGFLAFLDPPKETTRAAVRALTEYGGGYCQGDRLRRSVGKGSDGAGAGRHRGQKNLRQYDQVHQDDRFLQLWKHALRAGGKRIPPLPAHGLHSPDPAESDL